MKEQYLEYNQKLKAWAATKKRVEYIDVWTPMLDRQQRGSKRYFLSATACMNKKGYDIWGRVIKPYIR